MATPFKLKGTPAKNANSFPEKKVAKIAEDDGNPAVNAERLDDTPGKNPEIPWPPAENGPKPMR